MKKAYIYGDRDKRINYIEALEACGIEAAVSWEPGDAKSCGALLLPGGADMDPALYGAENLGSRGIDPVLDQREMELARRFAESGRPILGICRGLQVLNVAFGGTLIQDLPTAPSHCWEESTGDKQHMVTVPEDSFLFPLYGRHFSVNSAHHQGVGQVAKNFRIAAQAEDGGIEAIAWPEKNIWAVQFHPERMTLRHMRKDTVDGLGIFHFFAGCFW